jgi:hypothetical protein
MQMVRRVRSAFLVLAFAAQAGAYAQHERQIPPPSEQDSDYGAKFFDELRRIFGRFRDADLRRVFDSARAAQCSELATDKGEWREVAFFNENRKLGDWYRTSLDEVRGDLAVYVFKGACGGSHASLQVTTKFPVEESYHRYEDGRIRFDQIDVNVNAPVSTTFDPATQAYTFDLPYLYRTTRDGEPVYTLFPRYLNDTYAPDVTNHWDCKAVTADDVTYQFLICRTNLVPRSGRGRSIQATQTFGSLAYSILSDGKEASSSVKLSFGTDVAADRPEERRPPQPAVENPQPAPAANRTWRTAGAQSRLSEIGLTEFRLRFNPDVWKGKIDRTQFIADGMIANFTVAPRNKDYCQWRPRTPAQAGQLLDPSKAESIIHSLEFRKDPQAIVATFNIEGDSGSNLGSLQCSFSQVQTPAEIAVARWLSIAGSTISLETPSR